MSEKKDTLVFQGRRRKLVEELSASGLFSEKVLKAIGSVPRHLFVQKGLEDLAYKDMPVAIEAGQTISQPSTVAFQTQLLDFKPGDRILEIGTGCGYQTAVLFYLGAEVFSIERQEELFRKATENLTEAGYIFPEEDFSVSKIHLFLGDGFEGLKDLAPFDGRMDSNFICRFVELPYGLSDFGLSFFPRELTAPDRVYAFDNYYIWLLVSRGILLFIAFLILNTRMAHMVARLKDSKVAVLVICVMLYQIMEKNTFTPIHYFLYYFLFVNKRPDDESQGKRNYYVCGDWS